MREAFNPYSVLELTAGDVGEVGRALSALFENDDHGYDDHNIMDQEEGKILAKTIKSENEYECA